MRRAAISHACRLAVLFLVLSCSAALQAQELAVQRPVLTPEQIEEFLLRARVQSTRAIGRGVTDARRATLTDGELTHDAQIQTVDESKLVFQGTRGVEMNFKDSYRFNVAAYRLARLLGLNNVPVSVARTLNAKPGALTWWIDDVMMEEGDRQKKQVLAPDPEWVAMQIHQMRVFDELIQNMDRNQGNMLWGKDWTLWMIDHTRAFRVGKTVRQPSLLERCDRDLLNAIRGLTADAVRKTAGNSLMRDEIDALMARRDAIVALFDARVAAIGEAAVLYTMKR
jgi:hypothetical protein